MSILSFSEEHSEVYLQQTGDCWAYSSCNILARFIMITFFHYHPDKKFFIGKTSTANENKFSELFKNWSSFKQTISIWSSMTPSVFDNVKKNFGPGFFKKTLLYFFLYALLLDKKVFLKLVTKPFLNTFYKNINIDMFEKNDMSGAYAGQELEYLLLAITLMSPQSIQYIFKNSFQITDKNSIEILTEEVYEILNLFSRYSNENKLNIKCEYSNSSTFVSSRQLTLLKKILNQNLYCGINTGNIKKECLECLNDNGESFMFNAHSMTIVGYNKKGKQLIIKNSWNKDWCGNGFFLLNSLNCATWCNLFFINSNLPQYKILKENDELFKNKDEYLNSPTYKYNIHKFKSIFFNNSSVSNIIDGNKTNIVSSPTKIYRRYKEKEDRTLKNNCKTQNKDYNPLTKKCIAKCPAGKIRNTKTMKCIKNI